AAAFQQRHQFLDPLRYAGKGVLNEFKARSAVTLAEGIHFLHHAFARTIPITMSIEGNGRAKPAPVSTATARYDGSLLQVAIHRYEVPGRQRDLVEPHRLALAGKNDAIAVLEGKACDLVTCLPGGSTTQQLIRQLDHCPLTFAPHGKINFWSASN